MNVILIDFEPNSKWKFDKILEAETKEKWTVIKKVSTLNQGNIFQTIIRYLKYFSLPFTILVKISSVDKIIAWQQFYGIVYAFYYRLFNKKNKCCLYIMTFIYKEKKGFVGKIYKKFIQYALGASCVKKIFVFSESEPFYYSKKLEIDFNRFVAINLGVEDCATELGEMTENKEKYYLSVGRSNRDYNYLVSQWEASWGNLKIITDTSISINYDHNVIEVINGCYNDDYYRILSKCYAVIIPLENENISSGELVTIQAGMFNKPTIASNNNTLKNYIENGCNGYLCNKADFGKYISKLNDAATYQTMCINAREKFEKSHSLESMAREIATYI